MRRPRVPDAPAHGDDRSVEVRCAWCGRRALGERWVEPPGVDEGSVRVSHGICPECLERLGCSSPALRRLVDAKTRRPRRLR